MAPLDTSGLTELDTSGLTPAGDLDTAGLTQLDASGLTPLDESQGVMAGMGNAVVQSGSEIAGMPLRVAGAAVRGTGALLEQGGANAQAYLGKQIDTLDRLQRGEQVAPEDDPVGFRYFTPDQLAATREKLAADVTPPSQTTLAQAGKAIEPAGDTLLQWDTDLQHATQQAYPISDENQQKFAVKVARGVPGLVEYLGAAAVGGPLGVMGLAGLDAYGNAYQTARAKGVDEATAQEYAVTDGLANGALMAVPLHKIMESVPIAFRQKVLRGVWEAAKGGLSMLGVVEATKVVDNIVARETGVDPDRPITQGLGEDAAATLALGMLPAGAGAAAGAAARRLRGAPAPAAEAAQLSPEAPGAPPGEPPPPSPGGPAVAVPAAAPPADTIADEDVHAVYDPETGAMRLVDEPIRAPAAAPRETQVQSPSEQPEQRGRAPAELDTTGLTPLDESSAAAAAADAAYEAEERAAIQAESGVPEQKPAVRGLTALEQLRQQADALDIPWSEHTPADELRDDVEIAADRQRAEALSVPAAAVPRADLREVANAAQDRQAAAADLTRQAYADPAVARLLDDNLALEWLAHERADQEPPRPAEGQPAALAAGAEQPGAAAAVPGEGEGAHQIGAGGDRGAPAPGERAVAPPVSADPVIQELHRRKPLPASETGSQGTIAEGAKASPKAEASPAIAGAEPAEAAQKQLEQATAPVREATAIQAQKAITEIPQAIRDLAATSFSRLIRDRYGEDWTVERPGKTPAKGAKIITQAQYDELAREHQAAVEAVDAEKRARAAGVSPESGAVAAPPPHPEPTPRATDAAIDAGVPDYAMGEVFRDRNLRNIEASIQAGKPLGYTTGADGRVAVMRHGLAGADDEVRVSLTKQELSDFRFAEMDLADAKSPEDRHKAQGEIQRVIKTAAQREIGAPVKPPHAAAPSPRAALKEIIRATGSEPDHIAQMRANLAKERRPWMRKLYETRLNADPAKWQAGEGVQHGIVTGGKISQWNKGFRIVSVDPVDKMAVIRQVADTGLTTTGGNNDRFPDERVYLGDLKHDRKYDVAAEASTQTAPEQHKPENRTAPPAKDETAARLISDALGRAGNLTARELQRIGEEAYGGKLADGTLARDQLYDALELGVNRYIADHPQKFAARHDTSLEEAKRQAAELAALKERLPTQTVRAGEKETHQQFSTPPDYAYAVAWLGDLKPKDRVVEPSAGTGSIAIEAKNSGVEKVWPNEISDKRAEMLKALGFDSVTRENAEHLANVLPDEVKPSVVLMNPPFSATAGRMGDKMVLETGARHVEQALAALEPGGRLVAIVGRGMVPGAQRFRDWWKRIGSQYDVRANVGMDGGIYRKYGTNFGTRVLVIDKVPPSGRPVLMADVGSAGELMEALKDVRADRPELTEPAARGADQQQPGEQAGAGLAPQGEGAGGPERSLFGAAGDVGAGERRPDAEAAGAAAAEPARTGEPGGRAPGIDARPARGGERLAAEQPESLFDRAAEEPRDEAARGNEPAGSGRAGAGDGLRPNGSGERLEPGVTPASHTLEVTEQAASSPGEHPLSESVYEPYRPQRISIAGAKPHPGALVQSAAMASVLPPKTGYAPTLGKDVVDRGLLSDAQLEAITYAGHAHSQMLPESGKDPARRRGFFVGDGTGVGKGREVAGIILDNWNQGRTKALWISEKKPLVNDARRDWSGLGGNPTDVLEHGNTKAGDTIAAPKGILFTTYDTLKSAEQLGKGPERTKGKTRVQQVVDWLGKDFDGVIAFDEAHNLGNSRDTKGGRGVKKAAAKALAGVDLQRELPNARIVYVSATGATEVSNLAYADRLGLWGKGTAFADRDDFLAKVSRGGIGAMELVARDMKALGHYIARSLSYDGVEYDRVEHTLTPDQRQVYDKLAEGWQVVLRNFNEAMELTGVTDAGKTMNSRAKSAIYSAFWGAHQRFFNQVITSMQMPTVLKAVERDVREGRQPVLQLVNTNEAAQERALEKTTGPEDLEDLDMTPRDQLMQMVERAFPVQEHENYVDESGNERSRPVVDSSGKPVMNKQALALRESLLDELGSIRVPDGPLEMLLNHFGPDKIAEVTGRKQRVVRLPDDTGQMRTVVEKRGGQANVAEANAFQAGQKPILVFSEAGGTGRSYHAENGSGSADARRSHYLIQPGWRADKAVQGFGRTHRTNQASAPIFHLVTTDLQGQKRFISSIARRLAQLGALTKGERKTGDQGLFGLRDNLESDEAKRALSQFFRDVIADKVPGVTETDLQQGMGLKIRDPNSGELYAEMPEMSQFLNRVLSLTVDRQNAVFNAFSERLDDVIDRAAAAGTLDTGTETYKADRITKKSEQTVYTDPNSGAETRHVHLEEAYRNHPLAFDQARGRGEGRAFFVRSERSGKIFGATEARSFTDEDGRIVDQYRLTGPLDYQYVPRDSVDREGGNWRRIDDLADARKVWDEQVAKIPEFSTSDLHLITGAVLPIWDRLQGQPKIYRLQTDAGEKLLGRVVPNDSINEVLDRLGAEKSKVEASPQEIADKVLGGAMARLANGWTIKRSLVAGEPRLELKGADYQYHDQLRRDGVFSERISYETRLFIPTGERAAEVIGKITDGRPVTELSSRSAPEDEARYARREDGSYRIAPEEAAAKADIPIARVDPRFDAMELPQMRRAARALAIDPEKGIRGSYQNRDTGWTIEISRKGLEKVTSGHATREEAEALAALPELLRNAVLAESRPSHPERGDSDQIKAIHRLYAPIEIGGKVLRAKLTVRETQQGQKYYDHAMTEISGPGVSSVEPPSDLAAKKGPATSPPGPAMKVGDLLRHVKFDDGQEISAEQPKAKAREPGFTPAFGEQAEAVTRALRAELDRIGLKDVGLKLDGAIQRLVDGKLKSEDGRYLNRLITVALDSRNPGKVLDHEVVHAMKDLGLFTDREWAALEKAVREDPAAMAKARRLYPNLDEAKQIEEAVADLYARWQTGRARAAVPRSAFQRVKAFLAGVARVLVGRGFHTADSVFRAVDEGEVGGRERESAAERIEPAFARRDDESRAGQAWLDRMGKRTDPEQIATHPATLKMFGDDRELAMDMARAAARGTDGLTIPERMLDLRRQFYATIAERGGIPDDANTVARVAAAEAATHLSAKQIWGRLNWEATGHEFQGEDPTGYPADLQRIREAIGAKDAGAAPSRPEAGAGSREAARGAADRTGQGDDVKYAVRDEEDDPLSDMGGRRTRNPGPDLLGTRVSPTDKLRDIVSQPALPHASDAGGLLRLVGTPDMVASIHKPFGPVWANAKKRMMFRETELSHLTDKARDYFLASPEDKKAVNAFAELADRMGRDPIPENRRELTNSFGGPNDPEGLALSQKGETIRLTDDQWGHYKAIRDSLDHALDLLKRSVLRDFDLDPAIAPSTVKAALLEAKKFSGNATPAGYKAVEIGDGRWAIMDEQHGEIVHNADTEAQAWSEFMKTQRDFWERVAGRLHDIEKMRAAGYIPHGRFGDYGVLVKDVEGNVVAYHTYETKSLFGGTVGRALTKGYINREAARLKNVYRAADGYTVSGPFEVFGKGDGLKELGITLGALDKLASYVSADGQTYEPFREAVVKAFQAAGFGRHFLHRNGVGGYSTDIERALRSYLMGISGYVARREFAKPIDEAMAGIDPRRSAKLHDYATNYLTYLDSGKGEAEKLRMLVYIKDLGGNISSAVRDLTQLPLITYPYLSMFGSSVKVAVEMARASSDVARMVRIGKFDITKAPADVRPMLDKMQRAGILASQQSPEQMAVASGDRSETLRQFGRSAVGSGARRALQLAAGLYGAAQRANRLTTAIAAYRLGGDPAFARGVGRVLKNDGAYRAFFPDGFDREGFAGYASDATHFDMTKVNRPTIQRGALGATMTQFKQFHFNNTGLLAREAKLYGPEGKRAFAMSMAGYVMAAGVAGLPFAQNIVDLIEAAAKNFWGKTLNLETELYQAMSDMGMPDWVGEMLYHGASRKVAGVDMGRRIGLGDMLPTNNQHGLDLENLLGPWYSSLALPPVTAVGLARQGRWWKAGAQIAPPPISGIMQGQALRTEGQRNLRGNTTMLGPNEVTQGDVIKQSLGFRPASVARATEDYVAGLDLKASASERKNEFTQNLRTLITDEVNATGDEQRRAAQDKIDALIRRTQDYNMTAEPEDRVSIPQGPQRQRMRRSIEEGPQARDRSAPKALRGSLEHLHEIYPH